MGQAALPGVVSPMGRRDAGWGCLQKCNHDKGSGVISSTVFKTEGCRFKSCRAKLEGTDFVVIVQVDPDKTFSKDDGNSKAY